MDYCLLGTFEEHFSKVENRNHPTQDDAIEPQDYPKFLSRLRKEKHQQSLFCLAGQWGSRRLQLESWFDGVDGSLRDKP